MWSGLKVIIEEDIMDGSGGGGILRCCVEPDAHTDYVAKAFDYEFTGVSEFAAHRKPDVPGDFNLGVIVGSSGSGKSTLLREFGDELDVQWDGRKAIISHFDTPEEGVDKLSACGLNSIPTLCKPFHVLSNGEQFRANLARALRDNAVIDEFTSVVNRDVAKSASCAIAKYIRKKDIRNVVLATCHDDILEWLEPDWTYNCDTCDLRVGRYLQRPTIRLDIFRCHWSEWDLFKKHHYLSAELNKCCTCFLGVWNGRKIAFSASIPLPGKIPPLYEGDTRKKYRESRTVVLPDFQGLGIGVRFSDAIAQYWLERDYRFFSKTAHIRMGEYRQKSPLWRPTATNLVSREKSQKRSKKDLWHHMVLDTKRICYSHEYVGGQLPPS